MGACSVLSGMIVDSRGISGPATGSVNSFPFRSFVRSFWWWWLVGGCDDMRHRYGATICIADMVRRYARHENRNKPSR